MDLADIIRIAVIAVSALIALFAIFRNTSLARKRATIDLVFNQLSDERIIKANEIVNRIIKKPGVMVYADDNHIGSEERKAILFVLNNYEFIASGMMKKAFDISLYKRMQHKKIVSDWALFESFILEFRKQHEHPTMFQDFEWLAIQFNKKPLLRIDK